jgi:phage baseplate assembly protein W
MPQQVFANISALVAGRTFFVDGDFQWDMSAPDQSVEAVLQNVYNILSTPIGSQPLQRAFGLEMVWIGQPGNIGTLQARVAMLLAISLWEPRAEVNAIVFELNTNDLLNGVYTVQLQLTINLDNQLRQNISAGPPLSNTWVLDAPFDYSLPTAQYEELNL